MSRIWLLKKTSNERIVEDSAKRSGVLTCLRTMDGGSEWRALLMFDTRTLVYQPGGQIEREGPVVIGIRYHEDFLRQPPDPMEIVTLLEPDGVYHPNVVRFSGAMCLGHPQAGITMDLILNQIWAGLMFNMKVINTRPGQTVNAQAAEYVRSHGRHLFPISKQGLFEDPDHDLRSSQWHVLDPRSANHP